VICDDGVPDAKDYKSRLYPIYEHVRYDLNRGAQEDESVRKLSRKEKAELLRQKVDTVGQSGKPGEHIQNVISVGMLSAG
jgi:hypothetical protein